MSILCDLFVADPADAPHYQDALGTGDAADHYEVVSLGGLTQLQFETLWAITDGTPWSAATHAFEWVGIRHRGTRRRGSSASRRSSWQSWRS